MPGEGPAISSRSWQRATAPAESPNSDGYYLVDADRLRESYRKRAIAKLRRLRAAGKLKFGGKFEYLRSDENWKVFVKNLESTAWTVYIQPPPTATSGANEVVNYLTRYLTGGPISNDRIVAADRREVTFMAREGKTAGGEREQVPLTLEIGEFTRKWCLHIQPDQLTKTRYLGGWSNSRCGDYMLCCHELLGADAAEISNASVDESQRDDSQGPEQTESLSCPHCGSERLRLIETTAKPLWKELFWRESDSCPWWYADLQWADFRGFWDAEKGEGYTDWYLETQVEGAKETARVASPTKQLSLFDLPPPSGYQLDSF